MQTISDANVDQGTDWKNPRIFSEIRQNLHILTKIDENPAFFAIFLHFPAHFTQFWPSVHEKKKTAQSANFAVYTNIDILIESI